MKLYEMSEQYNEIAELMLSEAEENEGVISEEMFNRLSFLDAIIEDKVENCIKVNKVMELREKELDGVIKGIKDELARLEARKKSVEKAQDRMKEYVLMNMLAVGKEKIKTSLFTVYKSESKSVSADESKVPSKWFRVKKELDRKAIGEYLKAGNKIKGCELVTRTSLQVR